MNLDAVVNGLLLGGLYALVAVGLSIVFGVLGLINLAHGEILVGRLRRCRWW
jgi:branched-chain amino acid transport system permease protein